ncbi:prenylated Rab acceptor protein 1 [Poeciliopsis prolifica]|uniref:prenylated Rab acceptor protein 1 n=1 Tax=Poeciliopsis prolifica TaxID=188132 RepID=UPI00072CB0B3|nr:prenylated Rab acceptor protein 1 [Poeciliopsis prolifica]XP_054904121.1 prenylated Rab acceptor protein 1 [Poeciliopsis prolifica]XP_054904122.1 prenylated Rab acceptor protein 1 [Poeciliopsis prolifica]XP_054904123.1 prenylated Rab acceptor protein 1 [Poeciliopsis prolifica]
MSSGAPKGENCLVDMDSKAGDLFGAEDAHPTGMGGNGATGVLAKLWLPKGLSVSMAKEWFDRRRMSIRPWASFVDQRKFSKPRNFGELCQRVVKNVEVYNSNYTFIFLGLILYCIISSPMLLIALAVFGGAFYIIHLKSLESKLVILGKELTVPHQMGLAGAVSLPVFWLAGAGAAVFWVFGATLFVIGSHAAFRQLEGTDLDELLMESV